MVKVGIFKSPWYCAGEDLTSDSGSLLVDSKGLLDQFFRIADVGRGPFAVRLPCLASVAKVVWRFHLSS